MSATQLWIFGTICALLLILWLGDIFFNAPVENFDKDLSKEEQESEALGVVDSMKGELGYMRRDGLL